MAFSFEGRGAPTAYTVGWVGNIYTDTITGQQYECISVHDYTSMDGPVRSYIWKPIIEEESGGGSDLAKYFEGGNAEVILPNVKKLRDYAFYNDTSIVNVSLPDATEIGSYAFSVTSGTSLLASVSMPKVTSIGSYAFQNSTALTAVSMPKVTSIGTYAFQNSTALTAIDLPEGLTTIGAGAFWMCTSLVSVTFPSTLQTLGMMIFNGCSNLTTVTFLGTPQIIYTNPNASYMGALPSTLKVVNVPWAEGEVAGAPWGATAATINYNYKGE